MNTTDALAVIHTHILGHDLPQPWGVDVSCSGEQLHVQVQDSGLTAVASVLLRWANTITAPDCEAWYVPNGNAVHLNLTGQLPDGHKIKVYTGLKPSAKLIGTDLQPGGRCPVALYVLRTWAANAREVAA